MAAETTPGRRSRVTLKDLARHAGVSRSTVSLVLQESTLVARTTRERVQASMATLGYVYNRGAATLRSARTATMGVLVHDIANPFFAAMVAGVEDALQDSDQLPFLASSGDSLTRQQRFLDRMREQRIDALLLCPAERTSTTLIETIAGWGLPCIEIMRHAGASPTGDYVGADIRRGVSDAVAHLVEQGHQHVTLMAGSADHSADRERLVGYRQAMQAAGLENRIRLDRGALTRRDGAARTRVLMTSASPPTALICHNDTLALGALAALAALGLEAGVDCAVIGIDDSDEAALATPSLTSIATHPRALGRAAATLALRRLDSPAREFQSIVAPAPLNIRTSSLATPTSRSS
ncbi:LacI family DNA-binding transcriptional regulator [Kushneria aurantia]|uniref:LacI family DNA-binding transcriptional regulator n=1 Tax=Kushneria aurantia TaxID=504092 RepID=A0ABV6G1S6_9GAMM|nr:substrate-binding domain-containing protein [Kushneria aurantia]